ncbi:MAG: hypothetical protein U1F09_13465 [Steroidobacteraceae bacterium]
MKAIIGVCLAASLAIAATSARAGVYADDLGKCLVSSTTEADRALMVRWIFSAMSLNKEIAQYVQMSAEVRDKLNRDTAALYMRLMTESCRAQTRDAAKYEGAPAIGSAFGLLGQVATQGLFSDPAVAASISELDKYYDAQKLKAVMDEK